MVNRNCCVTYFNGTQLCSCIFLYLLNTAPENGHLLSPQFYQRFNLCCQHPDGTNNSECSCGLAKCTTSVRKTLKCILLKSFSYSLICNSKLNIIIKLNLSKTENHQSSTANRTSLKEKQHLFFSKHKQRVSVILLGLFSNRQVEDFASVMHIVLLSQGNTPDRKCIPGLAVRMDSGKGKVRY